MKEESIEENVRDMIFTLRINSGSCSTTRLAKRISSFRLKSEVFRKSG